MFAPQGPLRWFIGGLVATLAVAAVALAAVLNGDGDNETATPQPPAAIEGLPDTPDYHSLSVEGRGGSRRSRAKMQ